MRAGLATSIIEIVNRLKLNNINVNNFGYSDEFVQHGSVEELEKIHGLDAQSIYNKIQQ